MEEYTCYWPKNFTECSVEKSTDCVKEYACCCWKKLTECSMECDCSDDCVGFNYKEPQLVCELFQTSFVELSLTPGCTYYEVSSLSCYLQIEILYINIQLTQYQFPIVPTK